MITLAKKLSVIALLTLLGACSTTSVSDDPLLHVSDDPLEGLNRSIYSFNTTADKYVLRPASKGYNSVVPKPAKSGVRNFFTNLGEPLNALNNLLQGDVDGALKSTYRFTVNSTVGLLGLFDVAGKQLDVTPAKEDFGQTLAAWGVGPGPYIMLPFLGPTNLRDGVGRVTDISILYPINEITESSSGRTALSVLDIVALRTTLLGSDKVLESQLDQYAFLKRAFEQTRIMDIYDGNPPQAEEEDFDDF